MKSETVRRGTVLIAAVAVLAVVCLLAIMVGPQTIAPHTVWDAFAAGDPRSTLILDEATAEAGGHGARALDEAALAATRGRTTLVVAHRLTQAATADRIVVLEHGEIVETGTHDDLVAAGGRYAALWSAWSSRPVAAAGR